MTVARAHRRNSRDVIAADDSLIGRLTRMLAYAKSDVLHGQSLSNPERLALEAAARQMAAHGRDR
jgi:hypothetical protein